MVAYKNFWSLNTDESVVTGILRENLSKDTEIFIPVNAQMKDIDLIAMNIKNKKCLTIQVKGSKAYEPKISEIKKYGEGSCGWFFFHKKLISKSKVDYFIFLIYTIREDSKIGRRLIEPHTISIPTRKLNELCKCNKTTHGDERYSFYFWINPKDKRAFDWRDNLYDVSKYLDKKGFNKINKELR